MVYSDKPTKSGTLVVVILISLTLILFTFASMAYHEQVNENSSPQAWEDLGDQFDTNPLGNEGGGPLPTDMTFYPWPMHLHDEVHNSFTQAPAPESDTVLWSNSTGAYTYGSPAVADGKVFIGAWTAVDDYMYAFYQNNGTMAWRTPTFSRISGNLGVTSSPAYSDGYVVFGGDRIYCLWASNGTVKWTVNTGNGNWGDGSPTIADGKVFIGGSDWRMYAIDLEAGSVLWTYQTLSGGSNNWGLYSAPAVWNGHLYVAACDGWVYQILIDQPGPTAVVNHSFFSGYAMYGSPVIFDGKVYIGNGYTATSTARRFYALDATDLSVVWEFYPGSSTSFFSSAAIAYDKLYVGSLDGNLYVLDPYGSGGSTTVIWQYPIGPTWSSPAISSGKVFIGSQSNYLYAFEANQTASPDYLWRFNMNGDVDSSPAISDGRLYVGTHGNGGMLYAFGEGGDVVSPFPTSVSPTGNGVAVDSNIVVEWSEEMDWTSVDLSFSYTDGSSVWTSVDGAFMHDSLTNTSTFDPFNDLSHSATYWVTFSSAATDISGNPLDGNGDGTGGDDLVWPFMTIVDDPPILDLWEPGGSSGQSYTVGSAIPIVWEASDDNPWPDTGNVVNLSYGISPFGGFPIAQLETEDGIYVWDSIGVPPGNYYVNITVYDSMEQMAGSYSNYTFEVVPSSANPPDVNVLNPSGGESLSGGSVVDITWDMTDDITPEQNLVVYLNYTSSSGSGSISGPLTGLSPPFNYPWTIPIMDSVDVVVSADVIDGDGNLGSDASLEFEIDSTPPTVGLHTPFVGEQDVPTNTDVTVMWSEGMNETATSSSFSLKDTATWTPVSGVISWTGGTTLIFNPDTDLQLNTSYMANLTTAAKDGSEPGNNMLAVYLWTFATSSEPDITPPAIFIETSPNPQEVYGSVSVNASIFDQDGVLEAYVEVYDPSLVLIGSFTMIYEVMNNLWWYARAYNEVGEYSCVVSAVDSNGYWNSSGLDCSFSIVDTTPPNVSGLLEIPNPVEILNSVNISAFVTDNYALSSVHVNVQSVGNYSMLFDSAGGRYYNEHTCMMLGSHNYTIWAIDSRGNTGNSSGQFHTVDTESPQISHTPLGQVHIGSTVDMQATVTDNYLVSHVWLNYTDASDNHFNVSMSDLGGDLYQLVLPAQSQLGQIVYHIYAVDLAGNGAVTSVMQISVVEAVDDIAPMPPWALTAEKGPDGDSTVLDWREPVINEDDSPLDDLAGYHIYRSESETGEITRINEVLLETTGFTDENVEEGKTYYYWATAVDESGNESDHSPFAKISFAAANNTLFLMLLMAVIIIVLAILLLLLMLRRRKKTTPEAPGVMAEGESIGEEPTQSVAEED